VAIKFVLKHVKWWGSYNITGQMISNDLFNHTLWFCLIPLSLSCHQSTNQSYLHSQWPLVYIHLKFQLTLLKVLLGWVRNHIKHRCFAISKFTVNRNIMLQYLRHCFSATKCSWVDSGCSSNTLSTPWQFILHHLPLVLMFISGLMCFKIKWWWWWWWW